MSETIGPRGFNGSRGPAGSGDLSQCVCTSKSYLPRAHTPWTIIFNPIRFCAHSFDLAGLLQFEVWANRLSLDVLIKFVLIKKKCVPLKSRSAVCPFRLRNCRSFTFFIQSATFTSQIVLPTETLNLTLFCP